MTPLQFEVTIKQGTEQAFIREYANTKADGVYIRICCGLPLIDPSPKFGSGTGWPNNYSSISSKNVLEIKNIYC